MATTITDGTTAVEPALVLGWDHTRQSRTNVHALIGTPLPAVTLRPHAPRSGPMSWFFLDQPDAEAAEALVCAGVPLTIEDTDAGWLSMTFVVSGPVTVRLDPATRRRWVVEVEYSEVGA